MSTTVTNAQAYLISMSEKVSLQNKAWLFKVQFVSEIMCVKRFLIAAIMHFKVSIDGGRST